MAKSTANQEQRKRIRAERRRSRILLLIEILVAVALAAIVAFSFFSSIRIQENSMSPTLQSGDRIFVNRVSYSVGRVKRGDVIAYSTASDSDSGLHIKRVIGLPGETVQIRDGLILINGQTYIENQNFPSINNPGLAEEGIRLGSGEYFVLGDNRNNSEDSRFTDVGNISKDQIYGKVWFIGSPTDHMGLVR